MTHAIGTPVYHPAYGNRGHIVAVKNLEGQRVFILGGRGGPSPVLSELVIVWEDSLNISEVSEGIAGQWIESARRLELESINEEAAAALHEKAQAAKLDRWQKLNEERDRANAAALAFRDMIRPHIPANAQAVIVAELVEDQSDIQSDYFGSTTRDTVILGFSSHGRDLFPEMRKAAVNFPETAHLATAPDSAEHREKWSMGGGYYLKAGYRHDSGWKISKRRFYGDAEKAAQVPVGRLALTPPTPAKDDAPAKAAPVAAAAGFTLSDHVHTKKGFRMWIATAAERVERDEFDSMLDRAKALGGWYSRPWGGTPGGFAFKSEAAAREFMGAVDEAPAAPAGADLDAAPVAAAPAPVAGLGDKLRALADGLQDGIDSAFRDRQTNTPKRQRQADAARLEGQQMQRAQAGLRALADLHDAGAVPPDLAHVKTKAAALDLARSRIDHSRGGYYDAGRCTGEPADSSPAALAFWALLAPRSEEERRADLIRAKLGEIKRATIPGFFPTPAALVADMIEAACLFDGARVLEPSAGSGAILDAIRAAYPGAVLSAYEINGRLRELLALKGYTVAGWDFTESDVLPVYDAAVMNPPFEGGQDVAHVRKAFDCIKPGGRLVSIMAPGWQFNAARKFADFRDWLAGLDHEVTPIEAGAFKESGTGVASVMVTIRKPGA